MGVTIWREESDAEEGEEPIVREATPEEIAEAARNDALIAQAMLIDALIAQAMLIESMQGRIDKLEAATASLAAKLIERDAQIKRLEDRVFGSWSRPEEGDDA